jgi:murein DD-endopeptidase MepM/ murein hydrolase activator NlpD
MIKLIYRLPLALLIIFLIPVISYSFEIEVKPKAVKPGDISLLTITGATLPVEASFRGNTLYLQKIHNDRLIAFVPVDVNTNPDKYDISIKQGDTKQIAEIEVVDHKFKTIKLTLPKGKVILSPENQKRANREATLLNGIWPVNTSMAWDGKFGHPTNTEISTVYGVKRIMNEVKTSVHRGMDFRGKTGTPVKAINSGNVVLTDDLFYGGNTLIVDHGMGLYSVYMHLSKFEAEKGDIVSKGDVIALIGSSGRVTGPHLHMSVKLNGISVNPESLFELDL